MYAEIFSPDILIVLAVLALLFGGSKLPSLARSLGSAKAEFEKGTRGETDAADTKPAADTKAEAADKTAESATDKTADKTADAAADKASGEASHKPDA